MWIKICLFIIFIIITLFILDIFSCRKLEENKIIKYIKFKKNGEIKKYKNITIERVYYAINAGYNEDGIFNFYQGLAIYYLGDYKQAAAFFTESLKHNGRSIDTNKYFALTLEKLGRKESADVFGERVAKLQIEGARSPEQDINVRIF